MPELLKEVGNIMNAIRDNNLSSDSEEDYNEENEELVVRHGMLLKMFVTLLDNIRDINQVKDQDGNSLLHLVIKLCENTYMPFVKVIPFNENWHIFRYYTSIISNVLITRNIDINAKNNQGYTPLHIATVHKDEEMVRFLIWNKANINVTNKLGWPPLHLAIQSGDQEMTKLLIQKGADINAKAQLINMKNVNLTPIFLAIYYKQIDTLNQLIKKNLKTKKNKIIYDLNSLHFAALCDNEHFLKKLQKNYLTKDDNKSNLCLEQFKKVTSFHNAINSFGQSYKDLKNAKKFKPELINLFKTIHKTTHKNMTEINQPLK